MISGRNVSYIRVKHDMDQELEGIDIWDQDELSASHAPGIGGQIHVMLGETEVPPPDDVWFKHFRVATGDEDKI